MEEKTSLQGLPEQQDKRGAASLPHQTSASFSNGGFQALDLPRRQLPAPAERLPARENGPHA